MRAGVTLEDRALEELAPHDGLESFGVALATGMTLRQARGALQRLADKGKAEAAHCPDGAWVWFRTDGEEGS